MGLFDFKGKFDFKGLFDFGKKKKEQQMREELKQKYRAMSLKELISVMGNLWQVSSDEEEDEIRAAYILALFKADKSEGGFGIPAARLTGEANESVIHSYGDAALYVKKGGLAYLSDENGTILSINRELIFMGNYMRADKNADLVTAAEITFLVFELQKDENIITFTDEDIMDEHHQIYNAWLGEPGADPNGDEGFRRYKVQAALLLCTPEQCEKFGTFKRKNGVVTSEYATVDDLTGAKTSAQLEKLLDSLQTRF